jgi:hypothetical protein
MIFTQERGEVGTGREGTGKCGRRMEGLDGERKGEGREGEREEAGE